MLHTNLTRKAAVKSKTLLLIGVVGASVLSVVAIVAAVSELWWLLTAAVMLLLSSACIAALDADRRTISLRAHVSKEIKRIRAEVAAAPRETVANSEQDVAGAVRLLQAQYASRLDRLQTSIENTLQQQGSTKAAPPADERSAE